MKRPLPTLLLTAALLCAPAFADVPMETPITRGETTVVFRIMNPDVTAPLDAPKFLTVVYMSHSPKTALAQVTAQFTCDGKPMDSHVSWYGFGFPGPEGQSVQLFCSGEVHVLSVKIIEFSALSDTTF